MSQYDLTIIVIILLVTLIMMQTYIVFASYHSANRELGERVIEKKVEKIKYNVVPFTHEKSVDIDSHMVSIITQIMKHGIEGTPDNIHSFLKWLYGEDYSRNWVKQKDKSFKFEEDS